MEEELGEVTVRKLIKNLKCEKIFQLREIGTPRPDWRRGGAVVEGGEERWTKLLQGKSSNQLMDILLDDITHLKYSAHISPDAKEMFQEPEQGVA